MATRVLGGTLKRAEVHAQCAGGESPLAVIAHARRAQRRGRKPSMVYKGERNPQVALRMALHDVGAEGRDLQEVALREAPIPLFITPEWLRGARSWVHTTRQTLRALAIPFEVPGPLDDRTIVRLVPRLLDLAGWLDLPPLFARRVPARTGWHDAGDPQFTTRSSRLAGRLFPQVQI